MRGDARGRWYFNVVVQVEVATNQSQTAIGIDLGLKTTATCSDGYGIGTPAALPKY
ncbi:hypothetical protein [Thiothrix litoralis]|uniref:hypothetical protein n=1 Tax=Thiothrix litoralis TaxID=2891210 RepID=UPI00224BA5F7|nr:hypothetical protein [Thiothrix litoralis]